MPGKVVSLRLEEELLGRVDARARELGHSRTEFLTWAVESALDDAGRGVPGLPPAAGPVEETARRVEAQRARADGPREWAMERQRKLNEAKERRG